MDGIRNIGAVTILLKLTQKGSIRYLYAVFVKLF